MARFSDEQLRELSIRLDSHIGEFNSYVERNNAVLENLSRSISDLKTDLKDVKESTSGVVTLFKEGVVGQKWAIRVGKLIFWLAALYGGIKLLFGK